MKIIGTGLTGLVGSRIVELTSYVFDWVDFSLENNVDITNTADLAKAFAKHSSADAVLHLAAFTDVDSAWKQKDNKDGPAYRVNVEGTANIAKLCKETGKYLIHISTDFVFDGTKESPYTEEDMPRPVEWYGMTKYLAEQEVEKSGAKYTILRIAFPYKLKPSLNEKYLLENNTKHYKIDLVRNFYKLLQTKDELKLFSNQYMCPTFIDDIANVVKLVVEQKPDNQIFHTVGAEAITPFALCGKIKQAFNLQTALNPVALEDYQKANPNARPYPPNLNVSTDKLYDKLGYKMITVSEGIRRYADYQNSNS